MFAPLWVGIWAVSAIAGGMAATTDLTRRSGEIGRVVVEAVVNQIARAFDDDKDMLRRLACFQSHYGTNSQDLRLSSTGIWQISLERFRATQDVHRYSILAAEHDKIARIFNIQWRSVRPEDLKMPLYSGLAARLNMRLCSTVEPVLNIPESNDDLVSYWHSCAKITIAQDAVRNRKHACAERKCAGRMDMCVMIDSSDSIAPEDFQWSRDFVRDLLNAYVTQPVRANVFVFSGTVQQVVDFGSPLAVSSTAVMGAPHLQGGTATADAVYHCYNAFQNRANAASATAKVNLLLTDGQSNSWTYETLDSILRRTELAGITSYAVGVGPSPNQAELLSIAGNRSDRVFSVTAAMDLQHRLGQIHKATCRTPQTPKLKQKFGDSLRKEETRLVKLLIREDTEISLDVPVGRATAYYSFTHENPSPALHDGKCNVPGCVVKYPKKRPRRDALSPSTQHYINGTDEVYLYLSITGEEDLNNFTISAQPAARNVSYIPEGDTHDESEDATTTTNDDKTYASTMSTLTTSESDAGTTALRNIYAPDTLRSTSSPFRTTAMTSVGVVFATPARGTVTVETRGYTVLPVGAGGTTPETATLSNKTILTSTDQQQKLRHCHVVWLWNGHNFGFRSNAGPFSSHIVRVTMTRALYVAALTKGLCRL